MLGQLAITNPVGLREEYVTGQEVQLANEISQALVKCKYTRQEGNVLFNDALDTFYLRLYGVGTYGKGPFR